MDVQRQIDQLLAQRAAEWVDKLKAGDRGEHAAFLEWMRQSKLHVEHYLETEALDRQIQALDSARGPDVNALLTRIAPNVRPLQWAGDIRAGGRKSRLSVGKIAAALAILSVGAATLWDVRNIIPSSNQVATAVGEQRNVMLPDGSRIFVNALSRLRINYSADERQIELASGEAVFQVAKDPLRPFIVHTKTADVRAVGTQFNVYQRSDDTALVSVIEGRVQVTRNSSKSSGGSAAARAMVESLDAGEEAQVTSHRIEKRRHPDVAKTVGWREGRLYFDETPLEEMAREFNRYGGPLRFELEGIEPGQYRFGGVFNASEPHVFVSILERQKDLSVERQPDGVVVIRAR
jgi:transmembrane sensor